MQEKEKKNPITKEEMEQMLRDQKPAKLIDYTYVFIVLSVILTFFYFILDFSLNRQFDNIDRQFNDIDRQFNDIDKQFESLKADNREIRNQVYNHIPTQIRELEKADYERDKKIDLILQKIDDLSDK